MAAPPAIPAGEHVPTADQRLVRYNVPWSHFEAELALRGEAPVPRMAYLEGALELTTPSRDHERIKSYLSLLVATYALERGIDLSPYGGWTLKVRFDRSALFPDLDLALLCSLMDRPTALQAVKALRDVLRS